MGWTLFHHAADHGNEAILRLLVAEPDTDLEPPRDTCQADADGLGKSDLQYLSCNRAGRGESKSCETA